MAQNQDFSGFVFLDIETTGLEPHDDEILEIGIVLTDDKLNEIDSQAWVIATEEAQSALRNMLASDPYGYVSRMHKDNGLAGELLSVAADRTKRSYELEIIDWLDERDAVDQPMCGSSVGSLDRPMLKYHMPELLNTFHYRSIDSSSDREFYKRVAPQAWKVIEAEAIDHEAIAHRVIADCRYSIRLRKAVWNFVKPVFDRLPEGEPLNG